MLVRRILIIQFMLSCLSGSSQVGTVNSFQKISDTQGNFSGNLSVGDWFGYDVSPIGDLDGDGVVDLAVGTIYDDDGGLNKGAIYILFMNQNGTVSSRQKISSLYGNFMEPLIPSSFFGSSITNIGDLNGDGIQDLAVGATGDNDGGNWAGAIYILFMDTNGMVLSSQKISATQGLFSANLEAVDRFGIAVDSIGDFNGDGNNDIVVGASGDDDGGTDFGAVYVIYLNSNGTVNSFNKISATQGNFTGALSSGALFGWAVSEIGDWDGNGIIDIAVGAPEDDNLNGSVWILLLDNTGNVSATHEISSNIGLNGIIQSGDQFGSSITNFHDIDCSGFNNLIVGLKKEGGNDKGGVYILDIDVNGNVNHYYPITSTSGNFNSPLGTGDHFGWSVSTISDYTGDGFPEFAVGAVNHDDGGSNIGSIWLISVNEINIMNMNLLSEDSTLCNPLSSVRLDPEINLNASYLWQDGSIDTAFIVNDSGIYWVEVNYLNCSNSDTISINLFDNNIFIGENDTLCEGESIKIGYTDNGNGTYLWNTGQITDSIVVTMSGYYWLSISENGCSKTDSTFILIPSMGFPSADDTVICDTSSLTLQPTISNASYLWQDGSVNSSYIVNNSGTYWVEVNYLNCVSSDTVTVVKIDCICDYVIPNVFSPNNDNTNDLFKVQINEHAECHFNKMTVYNRWGRIIYDGENGWDGRNINSKEAPEGSYYYTIEINNVILAGVFILSR